MNDFQFEVLQQEPEQEPQKPQPLKHETKHMTATATNSLTVEDAIQQFNAEDWNNYLLENFYNTSFYEMLSNYVADRFPGLAESDDDDFIIMEETIGNATTVSVTCSLTSAFAQN